MNLDFDSSCNGVTVENFSYFQTDSETLSCAHLETQAAFIF